MEIDKEYYRLRYLKRKYYKFPYKPKQDRPYRCRCFWCESKPGDKIKLMRSKAKLKKELYEWDMISNI